MRDFNQMDQEDVFLAVIEHVVNHLPCIRDVYRLARCSRSLWSAMAELDLKERTVKELDIKGLIGATESSSVLFYSSQEALLVPPRGLIFPLVEEVFIREGSLPGSFGHAFPRLRILRGGIKLNVCEKASVTPSWDRASQYGDQTLPRLKSLELKEIDGNDVNLNRLFPRLESLIIDRVSCDLKLKYSYMKSLELYPSMTRHTVDIKLGRVGTLDVPMSQGRLEADSVQILHGYAWENMEVKIRRVRVFCPTEEFRPQISSSYVTTCVVNAGRWRRSRLEDSPWLRNQCLERLPMKNLWTELACIELKHSRSIKRIVISRPRLTTERVCVFSNRPRTLIIDTDVSNYIFVSGIRKLVVMKPLSEKLKRTLQPQVKAPIVFWDDQEDADVKWYLKERLLVEDLMIY